MKPKHATEHDINIRKEVIKDLTEIFTDGHRNMEESYFHKSWHFVETFTIIFTFQQCCLTI